MDELLASIRRIIADDEADFDMPRVVKSRSRFDEPVVAPLSVPAAGAPRNAAPSGVIGTPGGAASSGGGTIPEEPTVSGPERLQQPSQDAAAEDGEVRTPWHADAETPQSAAPHVPESQLPALSQPVAAHAAGDEPAATGPTAPDLFPSLRPAERSLRETLAHPPGFSDPVAVEPSPARAPVTPMRAPQETDRMRAPLDSNRRKDLLSPAVDAAVSAAFESLGDLVLPQKERTVEDLVKEILRPMLKEWLDKNLPDVVERLVRAEIERVSGTRR